MRLTTTRGPLAATLAALLASSAAAADKPLWEFGLGVSAVTFPDYRGSERQRAYLLPLPYLVYRGEILKADRNGLRGVFFDSDRVEFNLSLSASTIT
jgi:outer membrane scaffolding protein for murein synthesis (MipA/OmpV family)